MKQAGLSVRDDAGGITLISAALILLMLVSGAVLFDVMALYRAKGEAQTAADAAAKAAGLELTPCFGVGTEPGKAAALYAALNGARLLSVEAGADGLRGSVKVRVSRECRPLFISFGRPVHVTAVATAYLDPF